MSLPKIPKRLFDHVSHRPKYVTSPNQVYFKAEQPLELKQKVTGGNASRKKTPCIPQFLDMVDCLKRTGFSDPPCQNQIAAYRQCNEEFTETEQQKSQRAKEDIANITRVREMKKDQINILLENFHKRS